MTTVTAFKPLTKDDIAEVLGVSLRTIENWVNEGALPAPKKLGNRVYWHPNSFYSWLEHRLTVEEQSEDIAHAADLSAVKAPVPKAAGQAKPLGTEVGKLRSRDQSKLEAMLS